MNNVLQRMRLEKNARSKRELKIGMLAGVIIMQSKKIDQSK